MPEYDPLSSRIQDSIIAERDRLRKRVTELEPFVAENDLLRHEVIDLQEQIRRVQHGIRELIDLNHKLSERNAELASHARRWVQTNDAGLMFDPNPAPAA